MTGLEIAILAALIFAVAVLYSSVGHAGASGYIAAMILMGMAPAVMKPTALTLNIVVAGLTTLRWTRNGRDIAWRALVPLVLGSVPAAFIGGSYQLSAGQYKILVGLVLLIVGLKFLWQPKLEQGAEPKAVSVPPAAGIATGMGVGLLSGLTGTGGGIFLTPMLILFGWAAARRASGLTAPFILLNSMAALAGNFTAVRQLPAELPIFVAAALAGAVLGTQIGVNWASSTTLQRLLGAVLIIASFKFLTI
jgi:uncharacterized protein